jgi:hypothetical protein
MKKFYDSKGGILSIYPAAEPLTFGYWLYLVPQYRPKNVLILGYAGGTVAGYIRLFYGLDVPITGVDIADVYDRYDCTIIKDDARQYIKTCDPFDAVVVDLFQDGIHKPCEFIFEKEFANDLSKIGQYLIINAHFDSDMSNYKHLKLVSMLSLRQFRFYYLAVGAVPKFFE